MENKYFTRRSLLSGIILSGAAVVLAGCTSLAAETTKDKTKKATGTKKKMELPKTELRVPEGKEIATLANGCFWCTEAIFQDLKGVDKVVSGYSGGHVVKPSYEAVCNKKTGHAEGLQITFDPKVVSFKQLLEIFFTTHDPTTPNQQGNDVGPQYRSAIFYHSPEQKATAAEVIEEIDVKKLYTDPIVTEVTPFSNFYAAEGYHQNYYKNNGFQPYCRVVIQPKVAKFREKWQHLLKR